jgi:hypothetical protein
MRADFEAAAAGEVDGEGGEDGERIAGDDDGGEPKWESPPGLGIPADKAEDEHAREHECFICERIEESAEFGHLVEASGHVAIDSVTDRGEKECGHGSPAPVECRMAVSDADPVEDCCRCEHRNQDDS